MTFYLAFYVTFYLTFYLAFYLTSNLTFYLAFYLTYILTFYLEYLTYILTVYLTFFLAFCLTNVLAFYLAIFLAFYLTCVRVQIRCSGPGVLAFGARDMGFGSRRAPQPPGLAVRFGGSGHKAQQGRRWGGEGGAVVPLLKSGDPHWQVWKNQTCLSSLFLPDGPQ